VAAVSAAATSLGGSGQGVIGHPGPVRSPYSASGYPPAPVPPSSISHVSRPLAVHRSNDMDPNNHSPPPNSSVASPTGGSNGLHIGHNNNNNTPATDSRIRMSPQNTNATNETGQDLTSRPENVGYHNF